MTMSEDSEKKVPCCTHEQKKRFLSGLNTGFRVSLVAFNYIEDTLADVSADVTAGWPVGGAIALSLFANLSGFIFDVRKLEVNIPECESETRTSYILHFLAATAVFTAYAYSTYNGAIEDFEPEQFANNSNTTAFIDTMGLTDQALSWLALLPAMGWIVSEGTSGFAGFAGKMLIDKLLDMTVKNCRNPVRCQSRKETDSTLLGRKETPVKEKIEGLGTAWSKASFVLVGVGFAGIALQAWSSLFDVFAVTAAAFCAQPAMALIGLRVVTGLLALSLSSYFYDYYLRDAREEWVLQCMSHPAMRSFSALGMVAFFFAMSFNRARHFLQDEFALPIQLGESGFTYSTYYAAGMTTFNLIRYGLLCYDETKSKDNVRSVRVRSSFADSVLGASSRKGSDYGSTGRRSHAASVVVPVSTRSSASPSTDGSIN